MSRRCHDCGTTRRELNADRTGNVVCLTCYLGRHDDPPVPEAPRKATTDRRAKPISTARLVDTLATIDLAPVVVDDRNAIVRCICPACGSPDSAGMWRSLLVDGRHGLAAVCEGGCPHDKVVAALRQLLTPERTTHVA